MTYGLLSGVTLALAAVAALMFFNAYRRTHDRLFLLFGFAFVVLVAERLLLSIVAPTEVNEPLGYIPRVIAFGTMAFAIFDRNRR